MSTQWKWLINHTVQALHHTLVLNSSSSKFMHEHAVQCQVTAENGRFFLHSKKNTNINIYLAESLCDFVIDG